MVHIKTENEKLKIPDNFSVIYLYQKGAHMGTVYFMDTIYKYDNGIIRHDERIGYCKFRNGGAEVYGYREGGSNILADTISVGYVEQNGELLDSQGSMIAYVDFERHEVLEKRGYGGRLGYYYPDSSDDQHEGLQAGAAVLLGIDEQKKKREKIGKEERESYRPVREASDIDSTFLTVIFFACIAAVALLYKFFGPYIREYSFEIMIAINIIVGLLMIIRSKSGMRENIARLIIFSVSIALGAFALAYIHDYSIIEAGEKWIKSITDSSLLSLIISMSPFAAASLICVIALIISDGDDKVFLYTVTVLLANGALYAFSSAYIFFTSETIFGKTIVSILVFFFAGLIICIMYLPFWLYTLITDKSF
ncbi:UNVERIFIED_CONTAM: hypothetical protein C7383_10674 [Murimonas intestini]|uniref:MORN repeat protein n=2 Tax=Murimonas intestini TaxID=1337051 RepID=A0AB73T405_9FIRM